MQLNNNNIIINNTEDQESSIYYINEENFAFFEIDRKFHEEREKAFYDNFKKIYKIIRSGLITIPFLFLIKSTTNAFELPLSLVENQKSLGFKKSVEIVNPFVLLELAKSEYKGTNLTMVNQLVLDFMKNREIYFNPYKNTQLISNNILILTLIKNHLLQKKLNMLFAIKGGASFIILGSLYGIFKRMKNKNFIDFKKFRKFLNFYEIIDIIEMYRNDPSWINREKLIKILRLTGKLFGSIGVLIILCKTMPPVFYYIDEKTSDFFNNFIKIYFQSQPLKRLETPLTIPSLFKSLSEMELRRKHRVLKKFLKPDFSLEDLEILKDFTIRHPTLAGLMNDAKDFSMKAHMPILEAVQFTILRYCTNILKEIKKFKTIT